MTHNPDVFFQLREAVNPFVDALPAIVRKYMDKINAITGKGYDFFNYYGHPEAERLIIVMVPVLRGGRNHRRAHAPRREGR